MEQNYFQKMSGAIAAVESIQYIGLSIDEVGNLCNVPASLLKAAIHSVNPDILAMREKVRQMLVDAESYYSSGNTVQSEENHQPLPVQDFAIEMKGGVRASSFRQYGPSINAYATSTRSLPKICHDNNVSYSTCRAFMQRYYPEAIQRHTDILEGRFAVTDKTDLSDK